MKVLEIKKDTKCKRITDGIKNMFKVLAPGHSAKYSVIEWMTEFQYRSELFL